MSNNAMEAKVRELVELKKMAVELDAEIAAMEDEIKAVMGQEEELFAGCFKVSWKNVVSNRFDSAKFKKAYPELAVAFTKLVSTRRFSIA